MNFPFTPFEKISALKTLQMCITQKIHGTNAHILISEVVEHSGYSPEPLIEVDGKFYILKVGSRNRYIFPGDDNYGFASFVHANKEEFIRKLGNGIHYGEWAGPGINSGEGLTQKTFVLFNHWRFPPERPLPPQTVVVPVIYKGGVDLQWVERSMELLKTQGSYLAPGFMRPEGVVIEMAGVRYKKVFDAEETEWTKGSGVKNANPRIEVDYNHLCQPIRLEKLLSRDERYLVNYPQSLPEIVSAYFTDLVAEAQISGSEDEVKAIRKGASGQIFKFIKSSVEDLNV